MEQYPDFGKSRKHVQLKEWYMTRESTNKPQYFGPFRETHPRAAYAAWDVIRDVNVKFCSRVQDGKVRVHGERFKLISMTHILARSEIRVCRWAVQCCPDIDKEVQTQFVGGLRSVEEEWANVAEWGRSQGGTLDPVVIMRADELRTPPELCRTATNCVGRAIISYCTEQWALFSPHFEQVSGDISSHGSCLNGGLCVFHWSSMPFLPFSKTIAVISSGVHWP